MDGYKANELKYYRMAHNEEKIEWRTFDTLKAVRKRNKSLNLPKDLIEGYFKPENEDKEFGAIDDAGDEKRLNPAQEATASKEMTLSKDLEIPAV